MKRPLLTLTLLAAFAALVSSATASGADSVSNDHIEEDSAAMPRDGFNSPRLSKPVGPFSHAVRCGELVYLSGQVGQDRVTGKLVAGDVLQQTRQIFLNASTLLEDLDLSLEDIVKVNVFLLTMGDFAAMNGVYAEHFTTPYPARTTVAVKELPLGASVEMEMTARSSGTACAS